jgi:hypothetical protein
MAGKAGRGLNSAHLHEANCHQPSRIWLRLLNAPLCFGRDAPSPAALPSAPKPRIGLALGGGFARGPAHLGVPTRIIHEVLYEDRKGTVKTVPFRSNQGAR